ncbi:hypothetical protein [Bacillus sp. AFS073361]|uniref:hypothetical protein n=1 Tax=Bacillus sp. AFS073361 TaxID=2033511 RepID=UPI0015D4ECFC|nr:hypothetical protein [Bacillus sp. AFS073361]
MRIKRVKVKVWYHGENNYNAMATDGKLSVFSCYGTTREAAEEMARYRLRIFQEEAHGN